MIRKILKSGFFLIVILFVNCGLLYLCSMEIQDDSQMNNQIMEKVKQRSNEESLEKDNTANNQNKQIPDFQDRTKGKIIRVLIKSNGYKGVCHSEVCIASDKGMTISYGEQKEEGGTDIAFSPSDVRFDKGVISIKPAEGKRLKVTSLNRGCGHPSYSGELNLYSTPEGIVIINEISLEEYLYGVVPSEMPSSYEIEALKAQAICARSYAYKHLDTYAYPEYEANLDDSTSYQVYANSDYSKSAKQAVNDTKGKMIWYKDKIIQAYYYSTSCGKTASASVWGDKMKKKCPYLKSVDVSDEKGDYEKELPWYKWSAVISEKFMQSILSQYAGKDLGSIKTIEISERDSGGAAISMHVVGSKDSITIRSENKIRKALGGIGYKIKRNDGSYIDSSELLPSAFFQISKKGKDYKISGGGFGHGIGMSQNGANEMARCGKKYVEILQKFYSGVEVY